MPLMQIVSVDVPSEASPNERLDPRIVVKNTSSKSHDVLVWAVWFVGNEQSNNQMNPHPATIPSGASQEFTLSALMPENDIIMGFWVMVWQLNGQPPPNDYYEWILDTYTERNITLSQAAAEWKEVDRATASIAITTVPPVTGWIEVDRALAVIPLTDIPPVTGWIEVDRRVTGITLFAGQEPPPTTYTCPYCGRTFSSKQALDDHIEYAHPQEEPDNNMSSVLLVGGGLLAMTLALFSGSGKEKGGKPDGKT